ncbi:MAG: HAD family phosphatase [bacterium]
MHTKKLAIFDIDGTLFRSSLGVELIYELVEQQIFPKEAQNEIDQDYKAWINRQGQYEKFISQVVDVYQKHITGCKKIDVEKVSRYIVEIHKQRVYRYTRDLIKDLHEKGFILITISGSPMEIVKAFNEYWHFEHCIGTTFETTNGYYTGDILLEPAKDKQTILKQYCEQHNFPLFGSVGIGDTESDASFLELVDQPIAFNPNSNLKKIAEQKGWKIIVERKDVIYEIQ